jgi:hypothetical protein
MDKDTLNEIGFWLFVANVVFANLYMIIEPSLYFNPFWMSIIKAGIVSSVIASLVIHWRVNG